MGKQKILDIVQSENGEDFKKDLANHSLEYMRSKYGVTKKERYVASKLFDVRSPKIEKHWYTNGKDDLQLPEDCCIPTGYHPGRINCGSGTSGYVWINNGEKKTLVKPGDAIENGYSLGMGTSTTAGLTLYNNGKVNKYFGPNEEIPDGFVKGNLYKDSYKICAMKRKLFWYTDGVNDIRLKIDDKVPDGFVPGKAKKLSFAERIKARDDYYDSIGYIAVKNLTRKQLTAYCYYRSETFIIDDVIRKSDTYTYVSKKYLPLFDEYSRTNHSKGTSILEQNVIGFLKSIYDGRIITNCKSILRDDDGNYYEMDAYLPEKKIGIEVNGTYWHSNLCIANKNYHLNKAKMAEKNGIRLIQIYQHEWEDETKCKVIKSMLSIAVGKYENKIYARQCEIREISNAEAKIFNESNHLQGHRNAQITYGLFHEGNLVQLMSFSKTKYNRNLKNDSCWEIIRGCPGSNNIVVGGVSKLLRHFIKNNRPEEIFSYCDFNKFDGKGYEASGMKFIGYTGPNKWWVLKDRSVVNRQPSKYAELKENSFACIYGAGSKKYILKCAQDAM